jgi:peptidoglycan-associated lipoprotein
MELNGSLPCGLGATANIAGLHARNSGGGVPLNFVVAVFGPSLNLQRHIGKRPVRIFVHTLLGEANGFSGVYPQTPGPILSASGFAAKAGGGLDLGLTRHLSVRVLEINWLRTQLPNATTNVQNDVELGAGFVFHTRNH